MLDFNSVDEFKSALSDKTLKAYIDYWGNDNELYRFLKDSYVNKSLTDYLISRNIDVKNKNVLEFGCRDGSSFISFLYSGAGKIVGMDIDEKIIELSRMIYSDIGFKNVEFRKNKVTEPLPVADEEFDIISCNAVFEHIHPDFRLKYIKELQTKVKQGGYIIVSDTPNRLWPKDGHTTGIWFLNYLPFKIKCWLGSKTKRYHDIKPNDYNYWIEQGIEGVTYSEIYKSFNFSEWQYDDDLKFKKEYKYQIINDRKRNVIKSAIRYLLFVFAYTIDIFYLRLKKYPSLAISPGLIFSFRKKIY
ncbi:MAG: methyltransferase domain-containing protein [Ignavibacteriae bacterium]|nr:methyltransferase domain-containing protein [Ignavibacteriota bacterium]